MCPVCIATAALIAGSATGSSGLAALVVAKFRRKEIADKFPPQTIAEEVHDDTIHDGNSAS